MTRWPLLSLKGLRRRKKNSLFNHDSILLERQPHKICDEGKTSPIAFFFKNSYDHDILQELEVMSLWSPFFFNRTSTISECQHFRFIVGAIDGANDRLKPEMRIVFIGHFDKRRWHHMETDRHKTRGDRPCWRAECNILNIDWACKLTEHLLHDQNVSSIHNHQH